MNLEERINSFTALGEILRNILNNRTGRFSEELNDLIDNQYQLNPWFTPENAKSALIAIANELTKENLLKWTNAYPELKKEIKPQKVAVIMAGNIPLAGFHDMLSVLMTGNKLIAKTSSKDSELNVFISKVLCSINPGFCSGIEFTEGTLANFDMVIATGSNNTSRYFEYYFGKYPNIIRKNRNSIAIIDGNETNKQLELLGTDIFLYFGLGCRNVSKIYIPEGYDYTALSRHWEKHSHIICHKKYANNYDFNKAVFLVNKEKFHDIGYLLLKENIGLASPVSVLYYEYYKEQTAVSQLIEIQKENIQCIVGRNWVPFGDAQSPHLWDYADGTDTLEFLLKKKLAGIL